MHDAFMKTTLTLDSEIIERLRQEAELGKQSIEATANAALRRGLGFDVPSKREPYRIQPHSSDFSSGIDPRRLNRLLDDLEVETFLTQDSMI